MTAIPADIQKAASAVYAQLGRGPDADEKVIAKALMAERSRCAAIADDHADQHEKALPLYGSTDKDGGRGRQEGHINAGRDIAAAIRTSHPSPTAGA